MANSTIPFNVGELKYNGTLNSSHNLNNLVDGIYYIQATAPENAPTSSCVWCILFQITPTNSMIHQYIFKPASAILWTRERSGNPNVWIAWTKFTGATV